MFRESIKLGRLFGIRFNVSLTWLLVCAVVTWSLGAFYYPQRFPSWPSTIVWFAALLSSVIFFVSVVLHELGHALLATKLDVEVRSVSLFLFGGVTQFKRESALPSVELRIALIGPGLNLLLGMGCFAAYLLFGNQFEVASALLLWSAALNLALGIFNLLPWLPLDGGRVLRALAWYASDDRRWANRVTLLAGQLGAAALFFAGASMLITQHGSIANAIWIMLVGWFVHSSAVASYQTNALTAVLEAVQIEELMVSRLGRIERDAAEAQLPDSLNGTWGPEYYVVTDEGRDVGVFSISRPQGTQELDDPKIASEASLSEIIVPVHRDLIVEVTDTAMDALRVFVDRELQWAPVIRGQEVVGVIRRVDLSEYVEKHRGA